MSIRSFFSRANSSASILALVGHRPGAPLDRSVHPIPLPQGWSYPALLFQRIGADHVKSFSGGSQLAIEDIQAHCIGEEYDEAVLLAEAVRDRFDGFDGTIDSENVCFLIEDETEVYDAPRDGSEKGRHRVVIDLVSLHDESAPRL